MKQYATSDQQLNQHVFGNLELKYINFTSPNVYKLFEIKKPDTKRQAYLQQLEKLRIMFDLAYVRDDFHHIKMFQLNSEQLFTLLSSKNFLEIAPKEKVIECLK